jgi:hypothetical protein
LTDLTRRRFEGETASLRRISTGSDAWPSDERRRPCCMMPFEKRPELLHLAAAEVTYVEWRSV